MLPSRLPASPGEPVPDAPIPAYAAFIPEPLRLALAAQAEEVVAVPGLSLAPGLQARHAELLEGEALRAVVAVYLAVRERLAAVLDQRVADRAWLDARTRAHAAADADTPWERPEVRTVVGEADETGRVLVGPQPRQGNSPPVSVPAWLAGDQVTLFGPPDDPKLAINAMNALHRRLPGEPAIVAELVEESGEVPRWGADSEDSMTPLADTLLAATRHLRDCVAGTARVDDAARGKVYELAAEGRSRPIKRFPGLALPCGSALYEGWPLPLHLVDFVLHAWHNRGRPEALAYYVPKLETEEEAAYVAELVRTTEALLGQAEAGYAPGSVRLFIVFENPRAIFRIREIAGALHPWFVGGSLGWHDFLASTARLFKHEPRYRIPVKADPDIVIRHIKESHVLLSEELRPLGALALGGMYGVLPTPGDPHSFEVAMAGFIKDVVTQLGRGLDGFWVAHPDFVRLGLALVHAWRCGQQDPEDARLEALCRALVTDPAEQAALLAFLAGEDVPGLDASDPRYPRGVLAADLGTSPVIANDDPEEVRYNVFQALQYLAAWLSGTGCVALPAAMADADGDAVFVRVMDDLATTERSRWELWAEVAHGRVSREGFEGILAEEVAFLQAGQDAGNRRVQVRWEGEAARWYPTAVRLLRQLVTDPEPVEWVTELLLPFTLGPVREAPDPWAAAQTLCPGRFAGGEAEASPS